MNEPVPSFFFEVIVLDSLGASIANAVKKAKSEMSSESLDKAAAAFSEVNGLEIGLEVGSINEAGWSTPRPVFERMSTGVLELKRYLRPRHIGEMGFGLDPFSGWCQDTVKAAKTWETAVKPKDVVVLIYHPMIRTGQSGNSSVPVAGFIAQEAFPSKWGISSLNSTDESQPIIETIELRYTELQRLVVS